MRPAEYIAAHQAEIDRLVEAALPALQLLAAHRLAEPSHDLLVLTAADLMAPNTWFDQHLEAGEEVAFRRGYTDGYSRSMDDLKTGCNPTEWKRVAAFHDGPLRSWRYYGKGESRSALTPPPELAAAA